MLLLEAGDEQPLATDIPGLVGVFENSTIDYGYTIERDPAVCNSNPNNCVAPRGKTMGGTSAINGMGYFRGNKQDYDDWAELGSAGWSWEEVLPYFKKSQDLRQVCNIFSTHCENLEKDNMF